MPDFLTTLAGARVVVAGAGATGRSVADGLAEVGAEVTLTDADAARLASMPHPRVSRVAGIGSVPEGTALVVTSPGWRPDAPLLVDAAARGIEVIGDVELAWRVGADRGGSPAWLAVTGTNGKTTTVGMLESILRAAGADAVACGNIGLPVLDAVRAGHEVLAVELSSFQLHWSRTLRVRAAAVLNVSEDHLDWHGTLADYARAKGTIYDGASVAVHNAEDPWSRRLSGDRRCRVGYTLAAPSDGQLGVEEGVLLDRAYAAHAELAAVDDVRPAGPHNVADALAAAALARAYGVPADAVGEGLRRYTPGAHRAVRVAESGGITYIDDSKATNPHAAAASLAAHRRVVWIAGGQLKGAGVDMLVGQAAHRLVGAVLLGTDQDVIAAALARHAPDVPVARVVTGEDDPMTTAVRRAAALASRGDVVLLAPAAASLDMFTDYAQRGRAFAAAVHTVIAEAVA